jgi:hypothetical protein
MVAHFWSGHAHSWELAGWWVGIATPVAGAAWFRWWPSRRRTLARTAAETKRVLREIADAELLDDGVLADNTEDHNTEVDA